jgi:hypothetical protein
MRNANGEKGYFNFGSCASINKSIESHNFIFKNEFPDDNVGNASDINNKYLGTGGDFFCKHFTLKTDEAKQK